LALANSYDATIRSLRRCACRTVGQITDQVEVCLYYQLALDMLGAVDDCFDVIVDEGEPVLPFPFLAAATN
jgi:hypothetical protein